MSPRAVGVRRGWTQMPAHVHAFVEEVAGLASRDHDGSVTLLDDVDGRHADLADDDEMTRLCDATDELAAVLAKCVPAPRPAGTPRVSIPAHGPLSAPSGVSPTFRRPGMSLRHRSLITTGPSGG